MKERQGGFANVVLLAIATLIFGGGIASRVYQNQQHPNQPESIQNIDPSPTPSPSPTPTRTQAVPQQKVEQTTHDGTRTGKIVDYYSYCERKNIKIYENELLWLTANDGKQNYSTRSDLDCYNRDLQNKQNKQVESPRYTPSYYNHQPSYTPYSATLTPIPTSAPLPSPELNSPKVNQISKTEAESICMNDANDLLGDGSESGRYAAASYYSFCMGNYGYSVPTPVFP